MTHFFSLDTRAFTLVEALVATGICSLIALVLVNFFISNDSLIRSQQAALDTIGSAGLMMSEARILISQAQEVVSARSMAGAMHTTGTTTLVLRLPSIDASGNIITGQNDYALFYATGTTAYRILEIGVGSARASSTRRLSETISSLAFSYATSSIPADSSFVEVDIVTQKTFKKTTSGTQLRERIYLRNK